MTINTVVACLSLPTSARSVAASALRVAERQQARLVGLHVIPHVPLYNLYGMDAPAEFIEREEQALKARAEEVEKIFLQATKASNVTTDWRCVQSPTSDPVNAITSNARWADLVVMSQFLGAVEEIEMSSEVVLGAGRPVLIVPNVGNWQEIGTRVVIAWNGKREAARATFDALPFLTQADSVTILTMNPEEIIDDEGLTSGADLAISLSHHGVKAVTTTSHPSDISVGSDLLSRIADESCNLLVMGCYGHSRLREFVFGGVTREIMEHMTVPVLMSH